MPSSIEGDGLDSESAVNEAQCWLGEQERAGKLQERAGELFKIFSAKEPFIQTPKGIKEVIHQVSVIERVEDTPWGWTIYSVIGDISYVEYVGRKSIGEQVPQPGDIVHVRRIDGNLGKGRLSIEVIQVDPEESSAAAAIKAVNDILGFPNQDNS